MRHRLLQLLIFLLALLSAHEASGQCDYEVTAVIHGPWCGDVFGYAFAVSTGINENGDICGFYSCVAGTDKPFFWSKQTGFVPIEVPSGPAGARAFAINDAGMVVGRFDVAGDGFNWFPFLYDGQAVTNLGIPPGGLAGEATAINSRGKIVGMWNAVAGPLVPFLWEEGRMSDLDLPLGPNAAAHDINEKGQVTGWMGGGTAVDSRAFIWDDGVITALPPIPGGFTSDGLAINNLGDVVGRGRIVDPDTPFGEAWRAFAWINKQMRSLGTLPGFVNSTAKDINDVRQVVGGVQTTAARAFLWQHGQMIDLNDLVDRGLSLSVASGINNAGQIAAYGSLDGDVVAVVLTPLGRPQGDLDIDCRVGTSDLLLLLANWGTCEPRQPCPGDVDGDGVVGEADLVSLLSNWG